MSWVLLAGVRKLIYYEWVGCTLLDHKQATTRWLIFQLKHCTNNLAGLER
ncbi:hypothetical protein HMPREF1991_02740 [Hoylesella loescheii DSM 19665 = JCM 12249 = ATCC 15930]|uniref:Uncharacterized protein n=1 Tax=Hoylesella loescheii DSM 19665 = JCM 12249 = ATCC 15930 TaxID=1122985 RepID=A0A069QEY6_HOYLO|nr:hypothetical protein HMPREF1991_02740 [Hoylesella loescheii DSM 19665 = JCM 12249 = ATCC 15930]